MQQKSIATNPYNLYRKEVEEEKLIFLNFLLFQKKKMLCLNNSSIEATTATTKQPTSVHVE